MRSSAQAAIDEESSSTDDKTELVRTQDSVKRHNVFHTIIHSALPPQEKTSARLGQEGFVAIAAGGETCGRMMTLAIYYILANRDRVMPMLERELRQVMPTLETRPDLNALEQLPWLVSTPPPPASHPCPQRPINIRTFQTAVIRETLRLGALLTSRLPLVSPTQALEYKGLTIPPGHPVSMSLRHILLNGAIFRDPDAFRPERWLKGDPDLERINGFYVPFSRGTRNCIGINLAYAQVYIVLACVLRRFEMALCDVRYERDVKAVRDCFIGEPQVKSPGVRVTLKDAVV